MRVVHVAPPFLPLQEDLQYGGIERIISSLRKWQEKMDYQTDVLAPSDSSVRGLVPTIRSIGVSDIYAPNIDQMTARKNTWYKLDHVAKILRFAQINPNAFLHVHDDYILPFLHDLENHYIFTLHSPYKDFWQAESHPDLAREARNLVAVSNKQKEIFESHGFPIFAVVYNGIDVEDFPFSEHKDDFLLSLGAIIPQKGQKIAIEIARTNGKNLIIAGNIADQNYFDEYVKPYVQFDISGHEDKLAAYRALSGEGKIVYAGPVNDKQKKPLFAQARAFLMPTLFEDPHPVATLEALACGTPVIALPNGSMPEIVQNGITGFICQDATEMSEALKRLPQLDYAACRADAERRFSTERMANDYMNLYRQVSGL